MTDQIKRGRGRPAKGPGDRTEVRGVRLTESDWQWLEGRPGGASKALREMVLLARVSDATGLPIHP